MSQESSFVSRLKDIVGANHVKTDERDFAPKLVDNRKRLHGHVTCAVFPANTDEVSAVMKAAYAFGACVFTQGGNTSNVGGATPVTADPKRLSVLLSTDRMRHIEKIDTVNDTAVVQAGVVVEELQNKAQENNRLFAVSLAAQGSCTIGGILSTNAGGVHVLYYGNSREQCLGLEVVLYDGRVLNLMRGLRKDNTGYDLKDLFIGAEGTLGVITRAVVKLWPRPSHRIVSLIAIDQTLDLPKVFNAFHEVFSSNLTAFEVMHVDTLKHVYKVHPEVVQGFSLTSQWFALVELSFFNHENVEASQEYLEVLLTPLMDAGIVKDAVIGQSETQNESLWRIRESIPEAHKATGGNVKHDISVPRSVLAEFIETTNTELKATFPWIKPSIFGHFGDGNLHYNMSVVDGCDLKTVFDHEDEIHDIVYRNIANFGGSIYAEHGIGRMKKDLLKSFKSDVEYDVMQEIKSVFDPEDVLNPCALISPKQRS